MVPIYLSKILSLCISVQLVSTTLIEAHGSDISATESLQNQTRFDSPPLDSGRLKKVTTRHLVLVTVESAPFMMKRIVNDTIEWYGYCFDFFNELIKHLPYDITYEIYQVADNKFGSKNKEIIPDPEAQRKGQENHTVYREIERWNGLVGDLQQGKAHLALAPMAVMAERELVIDFSVPFYDLVGIQILLRKPEVPQDWFKFLAVLDGEVWMSITIAYFLTSFVIFLFDRLSPYSNKNLARIQKVKRLRSAKNHQKIKDKLRTSKSNKELNQVVEPTVKERFLSKSHHLFVGSMANPVEFSTSRQPQSHPLIQDIKSSLLDDQREVVDPAGGQNMKHRGSSTFSEYIQGIDFGGGSIVDGSQDTSSEYDDGKPDFSLRDSLWFCITSLTPQGGGEAPQNLSGRIVAGAWWLFCFIIIASYTANLAAFLTVSRLDIPIESLDDLAKQYRIKYAPIDGTAEQTYFERMAYIEEIFYNIWKEMSLNDSLSEEERSKFAVWDYPISDKYTKIWAQIQQVGMPANSAVAIQRVKDSTLDEGFALLADANMVRHVVMTDCNFKAVGEEFSRKPIALGLQKGNYQFKDDISQAILQLINQRYMEILREKWWTNNPNRVICDGIDESEGISVQNIGGVFIIIFAGVVLSFVAWAIEKFVYTTKMSAAKSAIKNA